MRILGMLYSVVSYLFGFASLAALILFVGGVGLPWSIDSGTPLSLGMTGFGAVIANLNLVLIWGLQHSLMADAGFKRIWTRVIPPSLERSTYVFAVGVSTFSLIALWSPMPALIWDTSATWLGAILLAGYFMGWATTLFSTFLINHFELFGLSQAWRQLQSVASKDESFVTPLLYKLVRHPMMSGVLIALWCAPTLSEGRLLLNLAMTIYVLIGLRHEEATLIEELGDEYREYQQTTPMLIPRMGVVRLTVPD